MSSSYSQVISLEPVISVARFKDFQRLSFFLNIVYKWHIGGERILGSWPFLQNSIFYSLTLTLKATTWKPSCPLCIFGLRLVLVYMRRRWWWEITPFSQEFSLWRHQSRYPGRSSRLKSQSVLQSKIGQKKFQIYFFLQRKDSENSVIKEGVLNLETFFLSLWCVLRLWAWLWLLRVSCSLCVIHTRQGHWEGNLSPIHMIV